MRSGKWLIVLVLLLVAGLAFWWWKSPSSDTAKMNAAGKLAPSIGVASMNISDIDKDHIKMKSRITISNPLPVDINTKKLNYIIYIDSVKVIEDAYEKPISIRSSDSSVIELPMELQVKPMTRILKYFDDNKIDSAVYTMKASFEVDVPVAGEKKFTMNMSKRLPAFRIPKIEVKDVDLHALSLKGKGVDMVAQVTNPNLFPLKIKNAAFSFTMEDAMKMDGTLEKVINIPAKGSQEVSMHAKVTDGSVLKSGWKMLTDKKDTQFNYKFTGKVISDNPVLDNSNMAMNVHGTLDQVLKAVKNVKE
jgi:LEA14-like dessication related protein